MKYGVMYYKATDNIGDDIQTYAELKYLPKVDYYVDREHLSTFMPESKEYVSVIMNGLYIHNKIAWPPSPYINPLLISMHFKELIETDVGDSYLKDFGGEFLKQYGPVGARDTETLKRLNKNGINSYFSGCMTLTLEKFEGIEKKKKICLVDVDKEVIKKVKTTVRNEFEIEVLSHYINPEDSEKKSFEKRMKDVENLLKKYQESHLVITSRLHVALPSVALDVPVILIHNKVFDEDRLGVFLKFVISFEKEKFLNQDIKHIILNPDKNSIEYIEIKEKINNRCKEFINLSKYNKSINGKKLNKRKLPKLQDYQKYTKNINWYIDIYERERLALENLAQKKVEDYRLLHNEIDRLNNIINSSKKNINF